MPVLLPAAIAYAVLDLAAEGLRAFNGLPEDTRNRIVNELLDDKAKRDAAWQKFTGWFADLFKRIDFSK